jgi:hypothetical protein
MTISELNGDSKDHPGLADEVTISREEQAFI